MKKLSNSSVESSVRRPWASDGINDLLLRFSSRAMTTAFEFRSISTGVSIPLTLRGSLLDGGTFTASDCVAITAHGSHAPKRIDRP